LKPPRGPDELRHHLIFDGTSMAQTSLRRHQSVPKKKRWRRWPRRHSFSDGGTDGAMAAEWRPIPMQNKLDCHRQGQECKDTSAVLRHLKYTKAVRQLAGMARQKAMDRDVLYHGTRFAELIQKTGVLFYSEPGDPKVSFTRSAEVAAYWALMERDDDEGRGSVFIFDRQSLERRYKIEAIPEVYWLTNTLFHDEAEEEIWANVTDIGNYLVGLVSAPTGWRSHKHKMLTRKWSARIETRARIEARLLLLERQMTFPF
jgi:hypothetical protein